MVEEVFSGIYKIEVTLPDNPMRYVNSYFIPGKERDLVIDTGFACDTCRSSLLTSLRELGYRPDRTDVLLTHLHADHSGLSPEIASPDGKIYLSGADIQTLSDFKTGVTWPKQHSTYIAAGFPEAEIKEVCSRDPGHAYCVKEIDSRFTPFNANDVLKLDSFSLRSVYTPGHTPAASMFYIEEEKIMFTGDTILFDISPNITFWTDVQDSLGNYLNSLLTASRYDVIMALPGHRKPGNYSERIRALLDHHSKRLGEITKICSECPGLTAYEISSRMKWSIRAKSWNDFPITQKWYAVGECIAHLDYLIKYQFLARDLRNGVYLYHPAENFQFASF